MTPSDLTELDTEAAKQFVKDCLEPFAGEQLGKKPQGTCRDCTRGQCSNHVKQWCETCKQNITTAHRHIDFVGHAHLTARLLKLDPFWSWEPVAFDEEGLPKIRVTQGQASLWIRLTVCGITRLGVGVEPVEKFNKPNENLLKELIGDCWASGTLITTARGQVPIEDVVVGDLVLNSSGWRRVTDHWSNGVRECIEVTCDGVRLVGTPTHRVPTPTGIKTLAEIKPGDSLWHDPSLLTRSSWSTAASSTTGGRIAPTTRTPASRGSIVGSTKTPTALFPLGGTSITSTRTRTTTTRGILRPSPRRTMLVCTGGSVGDGPFTVSGAATTSSHSSLGLDGARLAARRLSVETTARSHRPPGSPHPASDASTATPCSTPTNPGPAFAPLRVSSVRSGVVAEVWNLSVEGTHEYIANGVLSLNSLRNAGMRFGLALNLWAKGELLEGTEEPEGDVKPAEMRTQAPKPASVPEEPAGASAGKRVAKGQRGAKKAAAVPRKAATPPPRPALAPAAAEGPEAPITLFKAIPKELRQEAMAELTANPVEADEGVIGLWPFPTEKTRGENGEPISAETLAFVLGEAVDTLRVWAESRGIDL